MYKENYLIDKKGRKVAVQLPIKVYEKLIADSEELDDPFKSRLNAMIQLEMGI